MAALSRNLCLAMILVSTSCVARQATCELPGALLASHEAMAEEINLARTRPAMFAKLLDDYYQTLGHDRIYRKRGKQFRMTEGRPAVDEAVAFLRKVTPLPPLVLHNCLSLAAQDHVRELGATGAAGHVGSDGSRPSDRASRRLGKRAHCGENISFGRDSAREHVIALIVDDGVESRGHRANLFRSEYKSLGVGVGSHSRFRTVTVHMLCLDDL